MKKERQQGFHYWLDNYVSEFMKQEYLSEYGRNYMTVLRKTYTLWTKENHLYDRCPPWPKQPALCSKCVYDRVEYHIARESFTEFLYLLTDKDSHLLYIGISSNPVNRFRTHIYDKPGVSRMKVFAGSNQRQAVELAEYLLVKKHLPKYNKQYVTDSDKYAKKFSALAEREPKLVEQINSLNIFGNPG